MGGAKGLAGLPWAAAEVLEGYFSSWGVPSENCEVQTPSWAPQATVPKEYPAVKKSRVSICQGEMAEDSESLLKGNAQNIVCSHLPWALAKGGHTGLQIWRRAWGWCLWGEN